MRPQAKIALVTVVLLALTLGLLISAMLQQAQVSCEVCVTFRGRTQCRTAAGPDTEQAVRTATDNACGLLAAGMADGISCANTPPDSVTCED
jgi:hypothetical protein